MKFDKTGLIPMIIQDSESGTVLSLFYGNKESMKKMKKDGYVWRYSRSKKQIMRKGDQSGNRQKVVSISQDCDSDALLVKVEPSGPACHKKKFSCFCDDGPILLRLTKKIAERKQKPSKKSYVSSIIASRQKIINKLNEELAELIEAEKNSEIIWEAADLLFFMLVYLENRSIKFSKVLDELERRWK
ncbi:Phosphoribosyl-AMP cyclohydrolase [Candidatus Bilamarchaeum dharawalense]|uniref:Phosphoribosyl-AMP cyclohydrolase n=1 Tax=Candidatus Bilamarchaeum dharawalense TaxID=2885759 RepID=A0A5E4LPX5_9ARCH|nr:Phosphoribosyl-AMP cyclohydrolase [Candidatus Bilamarchaeum dharawalense]